MSRAVFLSAKICFREVWYRDIIIFLSFFLFFFFFFEILKTILKLLYQNRKHGCIFFAVHKAVFRQYITVHTVICYN